MYKQEYIYINNQNIKEGSKYIKRQKKVFFKHTFTEKTADLQIVAETL